MFLFCLLLSYNPILDLYQQVYHLLCDQVHVLQVLVAFRWRDESAYAELIVQVDVDQVKDLFLPPV